MILMILRANRTQLVMLFSALVFSVVNVTSRVTQEVLSSRPKSDEEEIPEHLPQSDLGTASSTSPALRIIRNKFAFNVAPDAGSFRGFFLVHSEAGDHRGVGGTLCGRGAGVRDLCL